MATRKTPTKKITFASELMAAVARQHGPDKVVTLDSRDLDVSGVFSTRNPGLDRAIGRGGVPWGRVTIWHGTEGSGKTTAALEVIAEAQETGVELAGFIDAEHKLDPEYAARLKVDRKDLLYFRPRTLEETVDMMRLAIDRLKSRRSKKSSTNRPSILCLDSLNSANAEARLKGDIGDAHIAPEARIWSSHMSEIAEGAKRVDLALMLISQVRKKIGVMFGDANEIAGGQSVKHAASLVIFVSRIGTVKKTRNGKQIKIGSELSFDCKKNQIAPPFQKSTGRLIWGRGFDFGDGLLRECKDRKIVLPYKKGLTFEGELIGNNWNACLRALKEDPELLDELVRKHRGTISTDALDVDPPGTIPSDSGGEDDEDEI